MDVFSRVDGMKVSPTCFGKATDDLVKYVSMMATNVAAKHNCKYAPAWDKVDAHIGLTVPSKLRALRTENCVVSRSGWQWEAIQGRTA